MSKEEVKEDQPAAGGVKNFRSSADVENFYRFLHENELRREAKFMLGFIYDIKSQKKKGKKKAKKKVLQ